MKIDPKNLIYGLAVVALLLAISVLWNLQRMSAKGKDVSNEAGDDAKVLLKEVTETAVEAIRERREAREKQ